MRWRVGLALVVITVTAADAGEIPIRGVGVRVAAVGDLDGDGKPEFAAANRGTKAEVVIVSTATGRELWRADGIDAAGIPDQDGDGKPEVAVALDLGDVPAWVAICKGTNGARLGLIAPKDTSRSFDDGAQLTDSVALLGDADGDAKPDLLVVRAQPAEFRRRPGIAGLLQPWCEKAEAFVIGLDGKVIADLDADANCESRTVVAAPAGDADGDGLADVFVQVDYEKFKLPLELRSIAKGVLLKFKGDVAAAPDSVAVGGDLDGDQKPDFLFGATLTKKSGGSEVTLISGKDGREIRTVKGSKEGDDLGESVVGLPDIDGDGVADFAAGAPGVEPKKSLSLAGAVQAYSGKTGKALWVAKGAVVSGSLGTSLAVLGDVDGDGVVDLAAGAPGFGPNDKGQVLVLSGKTGRTLLTYDGK